MTMNIIAKIVAYVFSTFTLSFLASVLADRIWDLRFVQFEAISIGLIIAMWVIAPAIWGATITEEYSILLVGFVFSFLLSGLYVWDAGLENLPFFGVALVIGIISGLLTFIGWDRMHELSSKQFAVGQIVINVLLSIWSWRTYGTPSTEDETYTILIGGMLLALLVMAMPNIALKVIGTVLWSVGMVYFFKMTVHDPYYMDKIDYFGAITSIASWALIVGGATGILVAIGRGILSIFIDEDMELA